MFWGYNNTVPYTNFHELNADWILKQLKEYGYDIAKIPELIKEGVEQGLSDANLSELIRDEYAKSGFVVVTMPPNNLTPAKGDGSSDDTATFKGCIEYLKGIGGGTVFVPNGAYLVDSLTLADNISLVGQDRYSTVLTMKGGAKAALLVGDVMHVSIRNIHLNGNSFAQTAPQNCVTLTANDLLIDNVLINNGYELLSLTSNGGTWQLTNIEMDNAGLTAVELLAGSEHTNVTADNWHVGYISSINGRYAINNGIDDAVFTNIFVDSVVPTGFNCGGSYCKFVGHMVGAVNPFVDLGEMNSVDLIGFSESKKMSGAARLQAGGIERDSETVINDNAENIVSNAHATNTVSGTDVVLNPMNPLTYKKPVDFNNYFKTIPAKSTDGVNYNILVQGESIDKIGESYYVDITTFGCVGDALYYNKADNQYYSDPAFTKRATNNAINFENALKYAKDNNIGTLFIPKGAFEIVNKSFIIDEGICLKGESGSILISTGLASGSFINLVCTSDSNLYFEQPELAADISIVGNYFKNTWSDTSVCGLEISGEWPQHRVIKNVGIAKFNIGLQIDNSTESHFNNISINLCDNGLYFKAAGSGYNPVPMWISQSTIELCARAIYAPNGGYSCLFFTDCGLSGGRVVFDGATPCYFTSCRCEMPLNNCVDDGNNPTYPWYLHGDQTGKGGNSKFYFLNCEFLTTANGLNTAFDIFVNVTHYEGDWNLDHLMAIYNPYYGQVVEVSYINCAFSTGDKLFNRVAYIEGTGVIRSSNCGLTLYNGYSPSIGNPLITQSDINKYAANVTVANETMTVTGNQTEIELDCSNANIAVMHLEPNTQVTVAFNVSKKYGLYNQYTKNISPSDNTPQKCISIALPTGATSITIIIPVGTYTSNFWFELIY